MKAWLKHRNVLQWDEWVVGAAEDTLQSVRIWVASVSNSPSPVIAKYRPRLPLVCWKVAACIELPFKPRQALNTSSGAGSSTVLSFNVATPSLWMTSSCRPMTLMYLTGWDRAVLWRNEPASYLAHSSHSKIYILDCFYPYLWCKSKRFAKGVAFSAMTWALLHPVVGASIMGTSCSDMWEAVYKP